MWDLRAGTPGIFHQKLEGHRGNISCLCYSPSGLLVSWAAWVPGWLPTATLRGSWATWGTENAVPKPICSELSAVQASGSWDKTIHIWKPSTRSVLIQLKGHITWVKSIAFSPDGQQLASAGYSHMVTSSRPAFLPTPTPKSPLPEPSAGPEMSTSLSALSRRLPGVEPRYQPLLNLMPGTHVCTGPNRAADISDSTSGQRKYCTECLRIMQPLLNTPHRQQNFVKRHQPIRLPYPSPFYFQVKVWDCNTGKCTETLKVRSVAEANKGAVEGPLGRPAPPEPNTMLLAGSSECGPCLCLYARRETLSVWSC